MDSEDDQKFYFEIEGLHFLKNSSKIFLHGVVTQKDKQIRYCQLRNMENFEQIQQKKIEENIQPLIANNTSKEKNAFNFSPCEQYLLLGIKPTDEDDPNLQIKIYQIDNYFNNQIDQSSVQTIQYQKSFGTLKNVMFGPSGHIILCQSTSKEQVDNYIQSNENEIECLAFLNCNYNKPISFKYHLDEYLEEVLKKGGQKDEKFFSPDGVFKCLFGYPKLELSDFYIDKFLFATFEKKTLIIEFETLNIIYKLDQLIYFSWDTEYLGYDSIFNIFHIAHLQSGKIEKLGQLNPPEGFKFDSKKPIVTNNSIIINSIDNSKRCSAVLVYDKFNLILINQYTLKELFQEKRTIIYFYKGLIRYFNNEKKKLLEINLYNSRLMTLNKFIHGIIQIMFMILISKVLQALFHLQLNIIQKSF
ncbi:UNKNOWN [Stylonychia lemnae]|uniref:Uncharacterized protein n=1 Tax=Stylonychia lemnae TaxID=5949 RepID=A0A077ZQH2_STYLE|nr:UNKNOWN [Stylonychia lemnae]|eukprot:CDW72152.1 UNKNOWN [Stylonychia lemnae]